MSEAAVMDERRASWKVLLPCRPDSRICAIGLDAGELAGLSRSYGRVDTKPVEYRQYDAIIVGDKTDGNAHDPRSFVSIVGPDGIVVNAAQKSLARSLNDGGFRHSRHYAALPPEKPRLFVPLASRKLMSKGLAFHSPGSLKARVRLAAAKGLSLLGLRHHLTRHAISIHARDESSLNRQGLIEWISARLGCPVLDLVVFAGSESPRRKLTALAITEGDSIDVVVKIADTEPGADAIKQESRALQAVAASCLSGQAPKLIAEGQWCGHYVQLQEEFAGRACRQVPCLTDSHLDFLSKLSTIGRKVVPLKHTRTWGTVRALADGTSLKPLPQPIRIALNRVLCDRFANMPVVCHRTHGDFAPWNMKIHNGKLFVYDWEDSLPDGLALTDIFHFIYRQAELVGPWPGAESVLSQMAECAKTFSRLCGINEASITVTLHIWAIGEYMNGPSVRRGELLNQVVRLTS